MDLVFAATACHWIDPAVRYHRAWELLGPGRHLAFWAATHVLPEGGDPCFRDIQDVYDEIGEAMPPGTTWPQPGQLPGAAAEIEDSGLFEHVSVRHFDCEVSYAAEDCIALLDTPSGPHRHGRRQRDRLYSETGRNGGRRTEPPRTHSQTVAWSVRRTSTPETGRDARRGGHNPAPAGGRPERRAPLGPY